MSTDSYLSEIEALSWSACHAGNRFAVIYARAGAIIASTEQPQYDDPGFVCRLNGRDVLPGLTFRMRQKISWRIAALIKEGLLT